MTAWRNTALSALVLALGLSLQVLNPPLLQELGARFFDLLQELKPRTYTPLPVRVVDIDDASLERLGQWPWPRSLLAELVDRLQKLGPAVIAFDLILAEPDRTSPARTLRHLPGAPPLVEAWLATLPDHDRLLAQAVAQAPVVTGFALTPSGGGRAPTLKAGWSEAGDDPARFVPRYGGAVADLPEIEAAAKGNGSLNILGGRDRIVRSAPFIMEYRGSLYPSLAAEALRVARSADTYLVKASGANGIEAFGKKTGITEIRIGDLVVDTDPSGAVALYDTERGPRRTLPAWRVMEGSIDPRDVHGALIFVGISAAGLGDLRATPLGRAVPGAEIEAQLAEQALSRVFLLRPDWAHAAELLYLAWLGSLLIFTLPRIGPGWSALFTAVIVAAAFGSSWYAFAQYHLLFTPVYPTIAALCVYLTSSLLTQLDTEREKRRVRLAFNQYLSPVLVEQLARDPTKLQLGGELRNMTFLFSDIRGFTSIAEQCKSCPEALTSVVNRFMTRMTEAILERQGTIDKYIGDCVMAFWNAPLSEPDHAARACEAALAMRQQLRELNMELAAEAKAAGQNDPPSFHLEAGIGINSGDCIVGNLGSRQRFDYSVLGDAVNLAARLEAESKSYNVPIVLGEATERLAGGFATLELDLVTVKGKRDPTRIFALIGDRALAADSRFIAYRARHAEMLAAMRARDWARAQEFAQICRAFDPGLAPLYDHYLARIESGERGWLVRQVENAGASRGDSVAAHNSSLDGGLA